MDEVLEKFTPRSLLNHLKEEICEKYLFHAEVLCDKSNPRAGAINLEDSSSYPTVKASDLEKIAKSFYERRGFVVSNQKGLKYMKAIKGKENYSVLVSGGEEREDPSGKYQLGFPMYPNSRVFTINVCSK